MVVIYCYSHYIFKSDTKCNNYHSMLINSSLCTKDHGHSFKCGRENGHFGPESIYLDAEEGCGSFTSVNCLPDVVCL